MLTDFKSLKRIAIAGLSLLAVFFALLSVASLAKSFWLLLALMAFGGIASSLAGRATESLAFKKLPDDARGTHVGFLQGARMLGTAISLLLGGIIFSLLGFTMGFLAFAGGAALVILCASSIQDVRVIVFEKSYWRVFKHKHLLALFAVMFLLSYHFGVENTTMSVYSKQVMGLGEQAIGWLFALNLVFYAVFNYFAGKQIDLRKNLHALFLAGLVISALGFAAYGFTRDFQSALAARIVHDVGDAVVITYALYSLSRVGRVKKIGGLQGVYATLTAVGAAIGAFASGFIAAQFGLSASFVASAALTLAGGALLLFINCCSSTLASYSK